VKTYKITMYVYNRSRKNGKAFGVRFYQGYEMEIYRNHANLEEATAWVQDVHNSGLLWVDRWNIEEK
jgi:hypothetical protein